MEEKVTFEKSPEPLDGMDDYENTVVIKKTHDGHVHIFYDDMNRYELLGMIEVSRRVVLDDFLED